MNDLPDWLEGPVWVVSLDGLTFVSGVAIAALLVLAVDAIRTRTSNGTSHKRTTAP